MFQRPKEMLRNQKNGLSRELQKKRLRNNDNNRLVRTLAKRRREPEHHIVADSRATGRELWSLIVADSRLHPLAYEQLFTGDRTYNIKLRIQ